MAFGWLAVTGCAGAPRGGGRADPVPAPPAWPAGSHVDTVLGVVVADPYRALERDSPDVAAWTSAHAARTRAALDAAPGRAALETRIAQLLAMGSGVVGSARTSERLLLVRSTPHGLRLVSRAREGRGWATEERLVFDPAAHAPADAPTFRANVASPDGRHVAIGRTTRGDADPEVIVVDAATGRVLPDRVGDVLLTSGGSIRPTWHPDGSGFFYPRVAPGAPAAERLFRGRFFFHRLGTEQSSDVPVFGYGVSPHVPMEPADTPNRMITSTGSRWIVGSVWVASAFGASLYAAPVETVGRPDTPWRRIAGTDDGIELPVLVGDTAYAVTTRGASRGRLVRVNLADPASQWEPVLPEQAGVLTTVRAAADALYLTERVGGAMRLLRLPYGATTAQVPALPVDGTLAIMTRPDEAGADITIESWLVPPRTYRFDPSSGAVTDAGIDPPASVEFADVVTERLEAKAGDGMTIPISVVRRREFALDGAAPLLLEAYGTFGVPTDPTFLPQLLAWVERGSVYAFAHVRGGGELGRDWHEAARGARKPVSATDLVAAAEHLIARGYTRRGRIGLYGVSAGGLLGANAVLERPDLFGAAIHDVSPLDLAGMARSPTGARNLAEFGWDSTPEGVRTVLANSPYHRLRPGTPYPAVLVHTGATDYNAGPGLAAKYVARLQAATTSGRPVLWDFSREGGHDSYLFGGAGPMADALAFMFWQLGGATAQVAPGSLPPAGH